MELIVETGAGLANATSYISLVDAHQYHAVRALNRTLWIERDWDELDAVLVDARILLDAMFEWRGAIRSTAQALEWPRSWVYDDEGRLIPNDIVPIEVGHAQAQLAYRLLEERGTVAAGMLGPRGAVSESIGDWSVTYRDIALRDWPEVTRLLRGLIARGPSSSGFGQARVERWS